MRKAIPMMAGASMLFLAAVAQGQSEAPRSCELEDWTFKSATDNMTIISGASTCPNGVIRIRVYDGESDEYLGNATGYIRGFTFDAILNRSAPKRMRIRYTLEED